MATIRVCTLENEPMANLVCSVMRKRRIPYTLIRTHDSVLDGVGEGQLDWGYIEAPERYAERIRQIVADLRPKAAGHTTPTAERKKRKLPVRAKVAIALSPLLLLLIAYYTTIALNSRYKSYFYYNWGVTFSRVGLIDRSLASYSRSIELNPNLVVAYVNRARLFRRLGDLEKVVADYSRVIDLEPARASAYYGRALAFETQKDYARAIADYSKAIELDPRYEYAYVNRAICWAKQGQFANALSDYTKAIALDPKDTLAYLNRGLFFARQGTYEAALSDLSAAIGLNPSDADAYDTRAYVLQKLGRPEEAATDAAKAEELRKRRQKK